MNNTTKIVLMIMISCLCILQAVGWYMSVEIDLPVTEIITLLLGLLTGFAGKPAINKAIYYFREKKV